MGRHVPPEAEVLTKFHERFALFYDPAKQHGVRPLIALAAAHHRLTWVHPFLDGNGQMARLFTNAYFFRNRIVGYGLWNVSRGLARGRESYRAHLAAGDEPREGDLDGRGNLSDRTLTEFCAFFLQVCQARYTDGLLALGGLVGRLQGYAQLREEGNVPEPEGVAAPLRPEVAAALRAAAVEGELARGELPLLIGMSERIGRDVLRGLLEEGLLVSPAETGPIHLGFPAHAASYLFPDLYPAGARRADQRQRGQQSEAGVCP